ncbi:hypothetical protein [Micromonospora sp. NPDC049645]|uniref:hypothetical protein n=1 Tax=Micromonospora sp. NPDC049645 TaxID=3155508 RepID=UPI0034373A40
MSPGLPQQVLLGGYWCGGCCETWVTTVVDRLFDYVNHQWMGQITQATPQVKIPSPA